MKKSFVFILLILASSVHAQSGIITAVPFLTITPDARAAGMGETGVASSPDVYSMHWNMAKYAFAEKKYGIGASYTPWQRALLPGVNHNYLALYMKPDSVSAFAATARYFSQGTITTTSASGVTGQYKPYEMAFDAGYSRRIAKRWALGAAFRYIHSNLFNGLNVAGMATSSGKSFAFDLGGYYMDRDRIHILDRPCVMTIGAALTNVGSKIKYQVLDNGEFLPINLRIGQGLAMHLDSYSSISLQYELNKLLVPTQPIYVLGANGNPVVNSSGQYVIAAGKDPNVSVPQGMLQSFNDAPGGGKEELREITFAAGAEYAYNKLFFARAGYFYEAPSKGYRQFVTVGAGVRFNFVSLDFAYLFPVNGQRNPLEKTLRFSLQFQFDRFRKSK